MKKDFKHLVEYLIKKKRKREAKEQKLADFILRRQLHFLNISAILIIDTQRPMNYIKKVILAQDIIGDTDCSKLAKTLHSNEAKMLLLGQVFTGKTVTLLDAAKMMWSKCVDDDMDLCVLRARAFMK